MKLVSPNDYIKLLTSQYQGMSKFCSSLSTMIEEVGDFVSFDFDIDTATGSQLDIIGQMLGLSRNDFATPLDDDAYRFALKAQVYKNQFDGTIGSWKSIFYALFNSQLISFSVNSPMNVSINISSSGLTESEISLIESGLILPRPSGVEFTINVFDGVVFSWDDENAGWDTGTWLY